MWQQVEQGVTQGWDPVTLQNDLQSLIRTQLVDREPSGHLTLTALGRYAAESGLEVRSVTQVGSLLRFAPAALTAGALVVLAQVTVELDALYLRTHARSRQEQARWPQTLATFGVPLRMTNSLHVGGGQPVLRAKRAAACLLFMSAQPFDRIEAELLQHTPERSAAGPIRNIAARTRDVIGVIANIAQFYGKQVATDSEVDDLLIRLEFGLPADMAVIARELGATLNRGDYLALYGHGLTTWDAIDGAATEHLFHLVGRNKANTLKLRATDLIAQ
jgi:helicase